MPDTNMRLMETIKKIFSVRYMIQICISFSQQQYSADIDTTNNTLSCYLFTYVHFISLLIQLDRRPVHELYTERKKKPERNFNLNNTERGNIVDCVSSIKVMGKEAAT